MRRSLLDRIDFLGGSCNRLRSLNPAIYSRWAPGRYVYPRAQVSREFSAHFGMHPDLGPLIHDAERNNGNINIRVNRIIQRSPAARAGDH